MQNWKARRSGGRITITGKDADGKDVKIPNVDTIEPGMPGHVIATDKDNRTWQLPVAA